MAWWYTPLEIADKDGKPTGRWRMIKQSDEDGGGPYPLCRCPGGHDSADAAYECWKSHELAHEMMADGDAQ